MRKLFALALCVGLVSFVAAQDSQHDRQSHAAQHAAGADGHIKRGESLGDSERVKLADVLKEPRKYAGRSVIVEGVVNRVCQKEGCWTEISPDGDEDAGTVRVTFDHKFAIPRDAAQMKFRAEGVFSLKTLSKEHVEHLVKDDGAKVRTNPDGTADEISFLATGVELWK